MTSSAPLPPADEAAPEPPAWYLSPSFADQRAIADAMATRAVGIYGVAFDPLNLHRHSELRDLTVARNLDAVLDPRILASGSVEGSDKRSSTLPWALDRPFRLDDFDDAFSSRINARNARFILEKRYAAVLATAHYI